MGVKTLAIGGEGGVGRKRRQKQEGQERAINLVLTVVGEKRGSQFQVLKLEGNYRLLNDRDKGEWGKGKKQLQKKERISSNPGAGSSDRRSVLTTPRC